MDKYAVALVGKENFDQIKGFCSFSHIVEEPGVNTKGEYVMGQINLCRGKRSVEESAVIKDKECRVKYIVKIGKMVG